MRKTFGLMAMIAAFGALPGAAHATKFWGTCDDLAGTAKFDPNGVGAQPQETTYSFAGTGHCTGAVGDKQLDKAAVHVKVAGPANVSCTSGTSQDANKNERWGQGTITLDSTGESVPFQMAFTATGSHVDIKIKGLAGGSGTGSADFLDTSNPQNNLPTLQHCSPADPDGNKACIARYPHPA